MNMFSIKVIAIAAMLVDHFALILFPESVALRMIGRLAFPLFAWLIANGAEHTSDIDRYLRRLFFFGILSQIPFEIGFFLSGYHPLFFNVLFTLFLGLLAIKSIQSDSSHMTKISVVTGSALLASLIHADYGGIGVLSIVAFYILRKRPVALICSQIMLFAVSPIALASFDLYLPGTWYLSQPYQWAAMLALPLIFFYNEKRGPRVQYLFYWFFPLQSFLILAINLWR